MTAVRIGFWLNLGLLVASLLPLAVQAQGVNPATPAAGQPGRFWGGAGLGAGGIVEDRNAWAAALLTLYGSYQFGSNLISARTAVASRFDFFIYEEYVDFGLLYGRATSYRLWHASLSLGLAGVVSTSGHEVTPVGLPVEAQLAWRPRPSFGLGLYALANLNPKAAFFGATLSVHFGRLHR